LCASFYGEAGITPFRKEKNYGQCKCVPQLIKSATFALPNKKKGGGIQDGSSHVNKSSDQIQSRRDFALAGG
jgi:hypothetical protein